MQYQPIIRCPFHLEEKVAGTEATGRQTHSKLKLNLGSVIVWSCGSPTSRQPSAPDGPGASKLREKCTDRLTRAYISPSTWRVFCLKRAKLNTNPETPDRIRSRQIFPLPQAAN
ncbi:hypothetical protein RRG08_001782 [Elysia crispata]|uniref:Uncharacterized protein n=1 Tax=Elysia crispata TaxID=231223 RepID=A0AAE1A8N2_9GAST|nr:hypothetical protein RRG08_001782 [Elysia crispata]